MTAAEAYFSKVYIVVRQVCLGFIIIAEESPRYGLLVCLEDYSFLSKRV